MSVEMCDVTASIKPEGRKAHTPHRSIRAAGTRPVAGSGRSVAFTVTGPGLVTATRAGSSMQAPVRSTNTPKPNDHSRSWSLSAKKGSIRKG